MKILIAEDDINSLILLESILLSRDYDVVVAKDGAQAWSLLQHVKPDLVISDILMPGIDGFELCRKIKSDSNLKSIPVIIYSATYIESRDQQLALAAGASRFVLKPIDPQHMLDVVKEVLTDTPTTAEPVDLNALDSMHIAVLQNKLQAKLQVLADKNHELSMQHEMLQLALEISGMCTFQWYADTDEFIGDANLNQLLFGTNTVGAISHHAILKHTLEADKSSLASAFQRLKQTDASVAISFAYELPDHSIGTLELHARVHTPDTLTAPIVIIGTLMQVSTHQVSQQRLNYQNDIDFARSHDPLTGFPNRAFFTERLESCIRESQANSTSFIIMAVDLDNFKLINDSLGQAVGDQLLQVVGERIANALTADQIVCRLGGDEFAIIVPMLSDLTDAEELATKLLVTIAHPLDLAQEQISISASIGISQYPLHGQDRYSLMTAADTAMHAAKSNHGNRVYVYEHTMATSASERLMIAQGLKHALEKNQLVLHYQPKVSFKTGKITGVEALVRWQHPDHGLIMPDRFIPIAEENGFIVQIGRWVLRQACSEPLLRKPVNDQRLKVAVNVSIRQFTQDRFVEFLKVTLVELAFEPQYLQLEITESTLQVLEQSRLVLEEIRAMGVTIAIDDFGTGYSSFSTLKHLPIDTLKIDKSFVKDIPQDPNDVAIVHGIIGLSKTLGMTVIAEGVETAEQLQVLANAGCDDYQGYLFSKPVPIALLERLG